MTTDRVHGAPQPWSWHHNCGHDCRDGLGCNVAEHYLLCTCMAIRERHAERTRQAVDKMVAALDWWGPGA